MTAHMGALVACARSSLAPVLACNARCGSGWGFRFMCPAQWEGLGISRILGGVKPWAPQLELV